MDLTLLLAAMPQQWVLYCALFVIGCKLVTVCILPPKPQSRWAPLFRLINLVALNVGWAENRLQIGLTGIMVPRAQAPAARAAIAAKGSPQAV